MSEAELDAKRLADAIGEKFAVQCRCWGDCSCRVREQLTEFIAQDLTASLAREGEMRRALEPFAIHCAGAEAQFDYRPHEYLVKVPLGDLRRAKNALASPAPSSGEEKS